MNKSASNLPAARKRLRWDLCIGMTVLLCVLYRLAMGPNRIGSVIHDKETRTRRTLNLLATLVFTSKAYTVAWLGSNRKNTHTFRDSYGNQIQILIIDGNQLELRSFGPDGARGTRDDIVIRSFLAN